MQASIAEIQSSLRQLGEHLQRVKLLRDANDSTVVRVDADVLRVTWNTIAMGPVLSNFQDSTIGEYVDFLATRQYSFLLFDGAILQMSYDVDRRNNVVNSRLLWYPCPVSFTNEDLEFAPIEELVLTTPQRELFFRSPWRIDYSPSIATADHPVSHLHSGAEDFRLPVQRAMEPSRFFRLIMRTAYPKIWREKVEAWPCENWNAKDRLTTEDRQFGFLGWQPTFLAEVPAR